MGNLNYRTSDIDEVKDEVKPARGRRADTTTKVDAGKSNTSHKPGRYAAHKTEPIPQVKGPRHKVVPPVTDPINIEFLTPQKHVVKHRVPVPNRNSTFVAATTGGILLAAISTGTGIAASEIVEEAPTISLDTASTEVWSEDQVMALATAQITYPKTAVNTVKAPEPEPIPVPEPAPVVVKEIIAPPPQVPVVKTVVAPAPVPVPVAVPAQAGNKANIIANAARAQLGRFQDCTMLVTNALASVGIKFRDWPAGYFSLGTRITSGEAVPGDLVYYANGGAGLAHIAVYVGNGQAVHGGWNGNQTILYSVNVGSGPVFIRVA